MKIYSKFNDYYDYIIVGSTDPIWERKEKTILLDPNKKTIISKSQIELLNKIYNELPFPIIVGNKTIRMEKKDCYILGFCGKLYPFYIYKNKTIQNPDEYIKIFNKHNKVYFVIKRHYINSYEFSQKGIKLWLKNYGYNIPTELFINLKSPIFLIKERIGNKHRTLIINPKLIDYNIQQIINPYTAYQEIDMYLGNELVGNFEPMPKFNDILKRDAHGMDKWSFKQKGPKKRKRKK